MNIISEYDERQLQLMFEQFDLFEKKHIPLNTLICNFEALINALEFDDNEWEGAFFEAISTLETINATRIYNEVEGKIPFAEDLEEEEIKIKNAIERLKNLVSEKIKIAHQNKSIHVSLDEIRQVFDDLIHERRSREDISEWALSKILAQDAGYLEFQPASEKETIWSAIHFLVTFDSLDQNRKYVHPIQNLIDFRKRIGD